MSSIHISIAKLLIPVLWILVLLTGCQDPLENTPGFEVNNVPGIVPDRSETRTISTANGMLNVICDTYLRPNGEIYLICIPEGWTGGDLAIYAHGYVSIFQPISLPQDEIEKALPLAVNYGMAFATTSFSRNGLAIQNGIEEIRGLKEFFIEKYGLPEHIYLTGGSQGGIITTLTLERFPGEFDGGFSLCGPCGNFQKQLNHYGDFRLLFDYFFPNILPRDADHPFTKIPPELIKYWDIRPDANTQSYSEKVIAALIANPENTRKLMSVSKAPFDPDDLNTIGETVLSTLWYHIFTIENSIEVLGGLAYDNTKKYYFGTGSFWEDMMLNKSIPRIKGDAAAMETVRKYYETSGKIEDPLVMMHTTLDPIQQYWQQQLYSLKILANRNWLLYKPYKIEAYGHCNFTPEELMKGFGTLVAMVRAKELLAKNLN